MNDNRLIAALDFHRADDAKNLVEKLGDDVNFYKVGMELFYAVGPDIVRWLKAQDKKIFLDLKLHDIPNTVAQGLCSLLELGADILNIHASGGFTMMKTAADQLKLRAEQLGVARPKLIAITVLTSINETDWNDLGWQSNMTNQAVRLARLALKAGLGLGGAVCGWILGAAGFDPSAATQTPRERRSTIRAASPRPPPHFKTAPIILSSGVRSAPPPIRKPPLERSSRR